MNFAPIKRGEFWILSQQKGGNFEFWPNYITKITNFPLFFGSSSQTFLSFRTLIRYFKKYLWGSFYWNTYCIAQFIFIKNVFSRGSIYFQDWLHFRNDVMSILVYTKIEKTHQNLTKNRTQHMHTLDNYFFSGFLQDVLHYWK